MRDAPHVPSEARLAPTASGVATAHHSTHSTHSAPNTRRHRRSLRASEAMIFTWVVCTQCHAHARQPV